MSQSPTGNPRFRVSNKILYTVLAFSLVVVGFYGYNYVKPYIGVPKRPDDFEMIFKYGYGPGNVLDTRKGTYKKEMIQDEDIILNFRLSDHELDIIWAHMFWNDLYNIEYDEARWMNSAFDPHPTYYLFVHAEGYPVMKIEMAGYGPERNSEMELRFIRIAMKIKNIIHSKPVIWFLPKPTGGYA